MKSQSTHTPPAMRILRPVLWGLCAGVIIGTLLLLLTALLVQSMALPAGAIPLLAVTAAGVGAFASGLTAARLAGQRGLLWGALCGALVYLLLLLVGLLRFGGVAGGYTLIKWAVLTVCGAVGGFVGTHRKRH